MGTKSTAGPAGRASRPRPTNSVRDELRELTRNRLIAAAQEIFEQHGFNRGSVGSIAAAARVNRATFYHHFNDKLTLFKALWNQNLGDASEYWRLVDTALAGGDAKELVAALSHTMVWYELHGGLLATATEVALVEPDFAREMDGTFRTLAGRMHQYFGRVPRTKMPSARLRMQLLMQQIDQLGRQMVVEKSNDIGLGVSRDELFTELAEIWLDTLPNARD
uniref:TetR/AcrR family transcriptional regulator n=1 Tax=Rhodococcus qingshengii TaxID=334542 RepID=UPI001C4E010A|nr:TetR/AcrR family transcriptional regulator [Rhodococcus qingshengii]